MTICFSNRRAWKASRVRARTRGGWVSFLSLAIALACAAAFSAASACAASKPAPPKGGAAIVDEALAVFPELREREEERLDAATELLAVANTTDERRVRLLTNRGSSLLALGQYNAAAADFREAVRLARREWFTHANLARALWIAGDERGARAEIDLARKQDRKRAETSLTAGVMDLAAQHWNEATAELGVAAANGSDRVAPLFLFVANRRQTGASEKAETVLRGVSRQPLWPRPIVDVLLRRADAATLDDIADLPDPIAARTWQTQIAYFLGEHAMAAGKTDEARARFRRAVELGVTTTFEFRLARTRLQQLGVPDVAVSRVDPSAAKSPARSVSQPGANAGDDDGWEPTDDTSFDREISRLVRSGAVERAIARLRAKKAGTLSLERMRTLAGLLLRSGKTDEALAALRRSLRGDATDWQPLSVIALTEMQIAIEHGSGTSRSFFTSLLSSAFDPAQLLSRREGAKHLNEARAAIEKAAALKPDDVELQKMRARILVFARDFAAGLSAWQRLHDLAPDDAEAKLGVARCLTALGRTKDAQPLVDDVLAIAPNDALAHSVAAEIAKREHRRDDERHHNDWAKFGSRLPPGSTLAFTSKNAGDVDDIAVRVVDFGSFSLLQLPKLRADRVRTWLADNSENATGLLAAALWNSGPRDEEALPIARELLRRGANPALHDVLEHADNFVALGAAARVLAEAHEPEIYERLARLLPADDDDLMRGDIAGALAALGDPRAMLPLVNLLDASFRASPRLSVDASDAIIGYQAARARAALALAAFDTQYAHDALEAGTNNPDIALQCRVALFVQTKDSGQLKHARSALLYTSFLEEQRTIELLEKTGDAGALEIVAAWQARKKSSPP